MRLSKERIGHMVEALAVRLETEGHIVLKAPRQSFVEALESVIIEEL
jgi:hypothetical protein